MEKVRYYEIDSNLIDDNTSCLGANKQFVFVEEGVGNWDTVAVEN